jgi:glycogen synthase
MKIIHVADSYLPTIGGLERAVQTLAYKQAEDGHDVIIVAANHPDEPSERMDGKVRVLRREMFIQRIPGAISDPRRAFHPTISDPVFKKHLSDIFKAEKPDIVHAHAWSMFSVIEAAEKLDIPVISTAHDYGHVCAVKQSTFSDGTVCLKPELAKCVKHANQHYGPKGVAVALGLYSSIKKSRSTEWTAISQAVAHQADGSVYEVPNMRVIPSYCPDSVLSYKDAKKPEWLPKEEYLCFVGALGPVKGIHILLQAQQELWNEGIQIPLAIIGTPRVDTPNLDLPGVTHIYNQPHSEVMATWRHAGLGVVPSVVPEAFGQVVVECMGAGTPVIGTNHGGIVDIIEEGVQGLKVEPNNVQALKEAIKTLWLDPKRRKKMGEAGIKRAEKFIIKNVINHVYAAYDEVISKKKAAV